MIESQEKNNFKDVTSVNNWPRFPWLKEKEEKYILPFTSHTTSIRHATLSKEKNILVTQSYNEAIYVWNLDLRIPRYFIPTKDNTVSIDRELLYGAIANEEKIYVWHIQNGHLAHTFHLKRQKTSQLVVTSKYLIAEDIKRRICVWNLKTSKLLFRLPAMDSWIRRIAVSHEQDFFVTTQKNNAQIWGMKTGKQISVLEGHTKEVVAITISYDDNKIITGSRDTTARVWNIEGSCLCVLETNSRTFLEEVAISSDGSFVVGCKMLFSGFPFYIYVWDTTTGKIRHKFEPREYVFALKIIGSHIFVGTGRKNALVWDAMSGKLLHNLHATDKLAYYKIMDLVASDKEIITVSEDAKIRFWDRQSGKLLHTIYQPIFPVTSLEIINKSKLVIGNDQLSPWVWDLQKNNHHVLKVEKQKKWDFVAGDQKQVLIKNKDRAFLWDMNTHCYLKTYSGPRGSIFRLLGTDLKLVGWQQGFYKPRPLPRSRNFKKYRNLELEQKVWKHKSQKRSDFVFLPWNYQPQENFPTYDYRQRQKLISSYGRYLWDSVSHKPYAICKKTPLYFTKNNFSIHPSNGTVAIFEGKKLQVWNLIKDDLVWQSNLPAVITSVTVSQEHIAVACENGEIYFYSVLSQKSSHKWTTAKKIEKMHFWDNYLLTVDSKHNIGVWNIQNQKREQYLFHNQPITDVSAHNSKLLVSSIDGAVYLWDYKTGTCLARLYRFSKNKWAVVTADGRWDSNDSNLEHIVVWEKGQVKNISDFPKKRIHNLLYKLYSK